MKTNKPIRIKPKIEAGVLSKPADNAVVLRTEKALQPANLACGRGIVQQGY